jgi:thiol-disulfide isomerase/thioredoxin
MRMTRKLARAAVTVLPFAATALVAIALVTIAAPHPLAAQQVDALFQGFEPTGGWRLAVGGEELPKAEIYENARAAALIVISGQFSSPLLVDVSGRQVSALQLLKVSKRADGRIDLLADAVLEPVGTIQIAGTEARFTVENKAAVVKPSPYVLGPVKGPALLDSNFGYRWRTKSYEPDAAVISRLRGEKRDVRVLTFFGTWCPHCAKNLPLLLRVEQRLADAKIRFEYHGLPSPFTGVPEATTWKVESVPTAIVLVGGKEVGRIPASGWSNPEVALDLILHP